MCGSCCAVGWAGGCSVPPAGPSSVTSKPSSGGWRATGHGSGKNARRRSAVIVFWDESGASLLPVTRRTWAPRGHTPIIRHHFNWKRASMAAALCYGSRGGGAALAFHHQLDAYDTDSLIGALGELRRFLDGQKATLLWDGLPAHRSKAMGAWLRRQRSWLVWSHAWLCARAQPGRGAVVQPQRRGAGQPRRRHPGGGHHGSRAWHPADPRHPPPGLLVPASLRLVPVVIMSPEGANLF